MDKPQQHLCSIRLSLIVNELSNNEDGQTRELFSLSMTQSFLTLAGVDEFLNESLKYTNMLYGQYCINQSPGSKT